MSIRSRASILGNSVRDAFRALGAFIPLDRRSEFLVILVLTLFALALGIVLLVSPGSIYGL